MSNYQQGISSDPYDSSIRTDQNMSIPSETTGYSSSMSNNHVKPINVPKDDSTYHLLYKNQFGTPHHNEAHQEEEYLGTSPLKSVIFNFLNNIIGAGIVGLPFVFKTSGLIGGLVLMVVFAFISAYSLKLLIIVAKECKQKNYEDLCQHVFGLKGYILVSITMLIFDFGATLSYLIILGDAASKLIAIWGYDSALDRELIVVIVSGVIILPTVLPRDIRYCLHHFQLIMIDQKLMRFQL